MRSCKAPHIFIILCSTLMFIGEVDCDACTVCTCLGTKLNCNAKGLTSIPANIPTNITELSFKLNAITTIDDTAFAGLTSVTKLELQYNDISSITPNAFIDMTDMTTLYINNNMLTSLPEGIFNSAIGLSHFRLQNNQLTTITSTLFSTITNIQGIYLTGNPLLCCTMEEFLTWTNNQGFTLDAKCTDFSTEVDYSVFDSTNCSVNGQWGEWINSSCSVTCGTGVMTRTRNCDNGQNCDGNSSETMPCTVTDCEASDTNELNELKPLVIGLVVGISVVAGLIALVTIILLKHSAPKVTSISNNNNIDKIKI